MHPGCVQASPTAVGWAGSLGEDNELGVWKGDQWSKLHQLGLVWNRNLNSVHFRCHWTKHYQWKDNPTFSLKMQPIKVTSRKIFGKFLFSFPKVVQADENNSDNNKCRWHQGKCVYRLSLVDDDAKQSCSSRSTRNEPRMSATIVSSRILRNYKHHNATHWHSAINNSWLYLPIMGLIYK